MSDGTRIPRALALAEAIKIMQSIGPVCDRVEVAGSLRRKRPDVGDIEIVAIPTPAESLFGDLFYSAAPVKAALERAGYTEFSKDGELFKQFQTPTGVNCDLFLTTPEGWGLCYLIRTGPAEHSRRMVTARREGGLMPSNLRVRDLRLYRGPVALPTPEEQDVYNWYGLPYLEPEERR